MPRKYCTYGALSVEEVLPAIGHKEWNFRVSGRVFNVKTHSVRLKCFKRSRICVSCGKEGNVFILEAAGNTQQRPHLNLYHLSLDGQLYLMTKDHIKPKSWGGPDTLDNMQTMCVFCNVEKGNKYEMVQSCY